MPHLQPVEMLPGLVLATGKFWSLRLKSLQLEASGGCLNSPKFGTVLVMSNDFPPFQVLKRKAVKHHKWDNQSNSSLTTKIFPLLRLSQSLIAAESAYEVRYLVSGLPVAERIFDSNGSGIYSFLATKNTLYLIKCLEKLPGFASK